jgi:hypothetical protein
MLSTVLDDGHTPRADFPLPRELRDLVNTHLPDSVHTRQVRLKDSETVANRAGGAYQFFTNILAVNKAVHTEDTQMG